MRGKAYALLAGLLLGSLLVASNAAALDLFVTDCGDTIPGGAPGQLRRLINEALPGDVIHVPACLIVLAGAAGDDLNQSGDLDIQKNLTIQGAGGRRTIIDGGGVDRVIHALPPIGVTVTLNDLMLRHGSGAGPGGGLLNGASLTLNRVIVRENSVAPVACSGAVSGGGAANTGTLHLVDSAVEGNFALGCLGSSGGGIQNDGILTLTRSTVSNNGVFGFLSSSGGIDNTGTLQLVDSTVSGNDGGTNGPGGIRTAAFMTALGSAIVNNTSDIGPANGVQSTALATLTNTIVANNAIAQCAGTTSAGGNLATDASCSLGSTNDAVAADAGLGVLSDQGGFTATHPLFPGSPAIDTALAGPCNPTDQRGMPRPQEGDGLGVAVCDKGPFEFTPPIFADVPPELLARGAIEALWVNSVTGGCDDNPLRFCPGDPVTRGQMAVLLLRALFGEGFVPPPAVGIFADVPAGHLFAPYIEAAFNLGITGGCAIGPLRYCPDDPVTRGQTAILLTRTLSVVGFVPPAPVGIFADVPVSDVILAPWVEEFFHRGLTSGCAVGLFCPGDPVTRAQLAIFLVRAFGLGF